MYNIMSYGRLEMRSYPKFTEATIGLTLNSALVGEM